jgi:hypothetical protein
MPSVGAAMAGLQMMQENWIVNRVSAAQEVKGFTSQNRPFVM